MIMPSAIEPIKGIALTEKPASISRCGMSYAKFVQHRGSKKWYQLSSQGKNLGLPVEFDFYKQDTPNRSNRRTIVETRELTSV